MLHMCIMSPWNQKLILHQVDVAGVLINATDLKYSSWLNLKTDGLILIKLDGLKVQRADSNLTAKK